MKNALFLYATYFISLRPGYFFTRFSSTRWTQYLKHYSCFCEAGSSAEVYGLIHNRTGFKTTPSFTWQTSSWNQWGRSFLWLCLWSPFMTRESHKTKKSSSYFIRNLKYSVWMFLLTGIQWIKQYYCIVLLLNK